jgi:hypothetical protein
MGHETGVSQLLSVEIARVGPETETLASHIDRIGPVKKRYSALLEASRGGQEFRFPGADRAKEGVFDHGSR